MDASEHQIKQIVIDRMDRCGVCHRAYVEDDVHVISRKPDMWMMLVQCTECHARNFVAAVLNDGDPAEARLALRQLSSAAERDPGDDQPTSEDTIQRGDRVSVDDVLDLHEFLGAFDGDFKRLFGQR